MFHKLKQFKDLRNQAKQMQAALSQEVVEVEKSGIKITINGNLEIIDLKISPEVKTDKMPETLKKCFNEAIKKAQRIMASKIQQMGGLSNLSNFGL